VTVKAFIACIYCLPGTEIAFFIGAVRPNFVLAEIILDNRIILNMPRCTSDADVAAGVCFVTIF
jgi:hypothetical protein